MDPLPTQDEEFHQTCVCRVEKNQDEQHSGWRYNTTNPAISLVENNVIPLLFGPSP